MEPVVFFKLYSLTGSQSNIYEINELIWIDCLINITTTATATTRTDEDDNLENWWHKKNPKNKNGNKMKYF